MMTQREADFLLFLDQTRRKLEKQKRQIEDNQTDLYVALLQRIAKEMATN